MNRQLALAISVAVWLSSPAATSAGDSLAVDFDGQLLSIDNVETRVTVTADGTLRDVQPQDDSTWSAEIAPNDRGQLLFVKSDDRQQRLVHASVSQSGQPRVIQLPLWLSLVPPLVAIAAAFLFKEVISSLLLGLTSGAVIAAGVRYDSPYHFVRSVLSVVDRYIIDALNESDHLAVIVFSLLVGSVVSVTTRNGGMAGVAAGIARLATTARRSMLATWVFGLFIFFDDYANSLIVGQTMRPISDRRRVSREKLAYLVDSTAAPIAATAFVSTWIGAELGYIADGISQLEGFATSQSAYGVFLASLKYCFYPFLTLLFTLFVIVSGRDFGPMLRAERNARRVPPSSHSTDAPAETVSRWQWLNAAVPVAVLITATLLGLVETAFDSLASEATADASSGWLEHWSIGWSEVDAAVGVDAALPVKIGHLLGYSNSFHTLMWSSALALVTAVALSVLRGAMSLQHSMDAAIDGCKTMLPSLTILTLAWALAAVIRDLHAAEFLTRIVRLGVSPALLPPLVFLLAAGTAFVTGSSWSTMAILYPLVIPLSWELSLSSGMESAVGAELLFNVVAVTLSGAVFGDHCSPISDTTILSSMATECDHLAHVRTQLPYALWIGSISVLLAGVSVFGDGSATATTTAYTIGAGIAVGGFMLLAKRVESP